MLTADRADVCIGLVQDEDSVLDDWIASLMPKEFEQLLERLDDLRDGIGLVGLLSRR